MSVESVNKDDFKLQNVSLEFGKCFEGENVRMDRFIKAYRELIRWSSGDIDRWRWSVTDHAHFL